MNKNDKTCCYRTIFYGITCTCFLAFVNVTCVTITIYKFWNGIKVWKKCNDTNTKWLFTVFDYVNLLNPDTIITV